MRSRSPFKLVFTLAAAAAAFAGVHGLRPRARPPVLAVEARLHLDPAAPSPWVTRAGAPPVAGEIELNRDRRPGLRLRAPGTWSRSVKVPAGGLLHIAWDVDPPSARATLLVRLHRARSSHLLRREPRRGDRGWNEIDLGLGRFAGEEADVELALVGDAADVAVAAPRLFGLRPAAEAPNVLVYLIDCLRADHVGAYGYARPTTPHLDALARDGVLFEDAWACASWTKPSVGCLFTSRLPVRHGARTIDDALDPHAATLAEALGAAGYESASFVANPFVSTRAFGLSRGFDRVRQVVDPSPRQNINTLEADAIHLNRALFPWLERRGRRRFFAYVHSLDLHAEYRPRPPFTRLFVARGAAPREVDLYDAELRANDHSFGELVGWLKKRGLYDDTLIVVTGDHGEEFGEHGTWRHGRSLNRALLHVPLIVKLPAAARRGTRVAAPVSNIDIAPTVLDLAGVARPAGFEGLSLRPLIEGRPAPSARVLFAEQLSPREVLYAARDARYKAVQQLLPQPVRRLFDLRDDPGETRDLSAAPPREARALFAALDAWIASGQSGWHLAVPPPPAPLEITLQATTTGRIDDVQRFAVELGETLTLSSDGRRLLYRFRAGQRARHVVLRTEPPDARVTLRIAAEGRPMEARDVRLGAAGEPAPSMPIDVDPARVTVGPADVARLLADTSARVRVFYVAAAARASRPAIDPELEQSLRALGYIH
jgi:arylsulfatase A-like enzyme